LKIFQNGGTIQDGEFLTFYFQKFGKNQGIKIKRKIKNGGLKQNGVGKIFSEIKIRLKRRLAAF
jgi:hypothetical protein